MAQQSDRTRRPTQRRPGVTSELKLASWLSAGALIAVALTIFGLSRAEDATQHWVQQSRRISHLGRMVLTFAVDAETGVRGYIVTHDRRSLAPQIAAAPRMTAALDSLVALTADNPSQRAAVLGLRAALGDWATRFARPVIEGSGPPMDTDLAGKSLFDTVRDRADHLILAEDALYAARSDQNRRVHHLADVSVILEIAVALVGLAWFIRQIIHHARAVEQQQEELEQQAMELEEQAAQLEEQAAELELTNEELLESATAARESRRRAEDEARQKSELVALLDSALGSAPIGFGFFDRELRFLRVNPMLAHLHDVSVDNHIGRTLGDIDPLLAKDVEPLLLEVMETRRPVMNVERRQGGVGKKHDRRDWLSSFFPIVAWDGELFGVGVAVTDVTEYKKLEAQLLQAQKMEAVGRLAGGIAHDFNNLLTVISSYAELLLSDPAMKDGMDEVQEIRSATSRAARLTRQLLAFSRRQAMESRILDPNDVLRGVETLLRRLVVDTVDITTLLSRETPLVRADPGQLEQMMMNLAINAADAMPEGGTLTIDTACEVLDEAIFERDPDLVPGLYAMIRVRDTGHGMDPITLAQIFEPFFTTKEPGRGTGLGLSTVYGIVKQSGGHIEVDSAVGEGTVFIVYLPAAGAAETAAV